MSDGVSVFPLSAPLERDDLLEGVPHTDHGQAGVFARHAGGRANETESSCTVTVPHDKGKHGEAIDDGEAYRIEP